MPQNAGDGYFGFAGKAFTYQGDKFQEYRPYLSIEPPDKRKLGFGTHDASRRDEFSQTIRTEQYRETLTKESRALGDVAESDDVKALKEKTAKEPREFVAGKEEIKHLYDVGRNVHTEFDPKNGREKFYSITHGIVHEKRMGGLRTASQDIGDGAWHYTYQKPEFSTPSQVKNFFDNSHLDSSGL